MFSELVLVLEMRKWIFLLIVGKYIIRFWVKSILYRFWVKSILYCFVNILNRIGVCLISDIIICLMMKGGWMKNFSNIVFLHSNIVSCM